MFKSSYLKRRAIYGRTCFGETADPVVAGPDTESLDVLGEILEVLRHDGVVRQDVALAE